MQCKLYDNENSHISCGLDGREAAGSVNQEVFPNARYTFRSQGSAISQFAIVCNVQAHNMMLMEIPTGYQLLLYLLQHPPCPAMTVTVVHQPDELTTDFVVCYTHGNILR